MASIWSILIYYCPLVNESYSSMQKKETKGVQIHKNMQVSWELCSHERLTAHPDKSQDECGTVSGWMAFPGKITLNRSSTNGDRENAKAAYPKTNEICMTQQQMFY